MSEVDWREVSAWAHRKARRVLSAGYEVHDAADLSQEALARLLHAITTGSGPVQPRAWLARTLQNLAWDRLRVRTSAPLADPTNDADIDEEGGCDPPCPALWANPLEQAVLEDLRVSAPVLFARLPSPCKEIARLQHLEGWTRREICHWLSVWRPVREEEGRRQLCRTHELLRALGRGEDPARVWSGCWNPEKNPWLTTPPPSRVWRSRRRSTAKHQRRMHVGVRMRNQRVQKRHLFLGLVAMGGIIIWSDWSERGGPSAITRREGQPERRHVSDRYHDLAASCLAEGGIAHSFLEDDPEAFESAILSVARVLEMHFEADFEAYLQSRWLSLPMIDDRRAAEVGALQQMLMNDFGVPRRDVPSSWTTCLGEFWRQLYPTPVLQEIDLSSCQVQVMHRSSAASCDKGLVDAEFDWSFFEHSFESKRESYGLRINHAPAIPHVRTVQEILQEHGLLSWFDIELAAVLGALERYQCRLLLRFVWDPEDQEWFLTRAVTSYPDHFDLVGSRAVLLF